MLAANGVGTARLLQLSSTGAMPDGLANQSGLVGCGLMLHPYAWVDGWFSAPMANGHGQRAGIVSLQFAQTDAARGFVRGCKLQLSVGTPARQPADSRPQPHVASLSVCAEDLPEEANRIALSSTATDDDGLPIPRMIYRVSPNSRANLDFGIERAADVLKAAGATEIASTPLKAEAGFHLMGTARMGNDPATSVVDRSCRCHDVPNLFIADASTFVTSSTLNPTATAQALALRLADHIVDTRRA